MRIIIESDEKEGLVPFIQEPTEPTSMEAIDGGAPSEELLQAVSEALPTPPEVAAPSEGINAGPPPEWLVEAIQEATAPGTEAETASEDAGAAPLGE